MASWLNYDVPFRQRAEQWLEFNMKNPLYYAVDWEAAFLLNEDTDRSSFVKAYTSKLIRNRPSAEDSMKIMVFPTRGTVMPVILPRDPDLNLVRDWKRPLLHGTHINKVKSILSANGVQMRGDRPDRTKSVRGSKRYGVYGSMDWQTAFSYCCSDTFLVLTLLLADRDVHLGTGSEPNYVMKEHWFKTIGIVVADRQFLPQGGLFADKSTDLNRAILYRPVPFLPECAQWDRIPRTAWDRYRFRSRSQSRSRSR